MRFTKENKIQERTLPVTKGKICVSILPEDRADAVEKMRKAFPLADVLEIRMDKMAPEEMDRLVPFSQLPVIITYRPPAERMEKREALISMHMAFQAIRLGAAYLDLGMDMPQEMRQEIIREKGKTKVIISCHFTDTTPSAKYLGKTMQIMAGTGADTVKIVTMASNARDCMTVLDLIASGKELGVDVSAFCMGAAGRWSRIACLLMGGCMSYASLSEAEKTAEGQIPAAQMRCILEILQYGT